MKKTYIAPAVEINNAEVSTIIAISVQIGDNSESHSHTGDVKEQGDWNIWDDVED